jgi:hypothetical protein
VPRSVRFEVPPEVAFDYLVDPRNRAAWQSSLRRVEHVTGEPRVGQRWVDVTVPGLRPRMETTVLDRPRRWTEVGRWHAIDAELTLLFEPEGTGCRVTPEFTVTGRGVAALPAYVVDKVAVLAVLPDLRRAADNLSRRA